MMLDKLGASDGTIVRVVEVIQVDRIRGCGKPGCVDSARMVTEYYDRDGRLLWCYDPLREENESTG
jgi:hypothetical protein